MNEQGMAGGVSRRAFIKGVIAAGATVSASAYLFRTTIVGQNESSLPGSVERLITIDVNGQQRRVDVLKHETLAMTLRYKLGLTGTKLGCDRGECGACAGKRSRRWRDWRAPTASSPPCSKVSSIRRASSAPSACPAS